MTSPGRLTITAALAGQTLPGILRAMDSSLSWTTARALVRARRVRINGVLCLDETRRLRQSEEIQLLPQSAKPLPQPTDIQVVHADSSILVIDKPAGMVCKRRSEEQHWHAQQKARTITVQESLQANGYQVFPVHRLDRETSGLMVYALTRAAQDHLIHLFARHQIQRHYLAVALGNVSTQSCHSWIIRDRGDGRRGLLDSPRPDAQKAITHFTALEHLGDAYTILDCRLETGRTHQIRLHLAHLGHPVCGEKLYCQPSQDPSHPPRHALHCCRLGFTHPATNHPLDFHRPLPPDLQRWLTHLRQSLSR